MKKYILVTKNIYFWHDSLYNQIFEVYAEEHNTYDFHHENGGCCRIRKECCIESDSIEFLEKYIENIKYLS